MHAIATRSPGFAMLQQLLFHALVSSLAVGIAFSAAPAARFILYEWWPRVSASSKLLLASELVVAAVLVLAFNAVGIAWQGLRAKRLHDIAALVQVRRDGERGLGLATRESAAKARDALILSVTGAHTFGAPGAPFRALLESCQEARVLLLNPRSEGARRRIRSLPDPVEAERLYHEEVAASIAYLASLRESGKRVSLRLYDHAPFWSIVVAGERAWVRHCHDGHPLRTQPDYAFALRPDDPTQGLFPPFCRFALEQWNDPANADYDFATGKLVRRPVAGVGDGSGELSRITVPA